MDSRDALARLSTARVGRMATVGTDGTPHVVPFVFVLDGRTLYWAVDRKRKRSLKLKRLENLQANPSVEVVVDAYDEDWRSLWWVRARGIGRVVEDAAEAETALRLLADKYPQYRVDPPDGPVVAVEISGVAGWQAVPPGP